MSLTSQILPLNGQPTLHINGKPSTGLIHWNRNLTAADAKFFADCGVNLLSFIGYLPLRKTPDQVPDYSDGMGSFPELTEDYVDKLLEELLTANPQALFLPRLRITVPDWWKEAYPGTLLHSYNLSAKSWEAGPHVSPCCQSWNDLVASQLQTTVRHLEEHWGDRIFGYHAGMYECGEHAYRWGSFISDLNPLNTLPFQRWLRRKYGTEQALSQAWNRSVAFRDVALPQPEDYVAQSPVDARVVLNPETEQHLMDFADFSAEAMADQILLEARTVKQTLRNLGRQKVFGAFHMYQNIYPNAANDFALWPHASEKLLKSPDIDFIAAPLAYDARQPGGTANSQILPNAITLAGKLYYAEEDTRLHLVQSLPDCVAGTPEASHSILMRDFFATWRTGGSLWWMDLVGQGWFRNPSFMKTFQTCQTLAQETLSSRTTPAQIAVFISDESTACKRGVPTTFHGNLTGQNLQEIAAMGAPYDLFRLEDLPSLVSAQRLKTYRFCIVLNAVTINDTLRDYIATYLHAGKRTVLYYYLPGYLRDRRFSDQAASQLTGLALRTVPHAPLTSLLTETWLDGLRITYGHPRNITPRLVCCDSQAVPLGYYVEGALSCHPAVSQGVSFALRDFSTHRIVWSSSPNLPSCWLQRLAQEAGVHIYSRRGDLVFPLGDYLGISCKVTGPLTVSFRQPVSVTDEATGKRLGHNLTELTCDTRRGEWKLWKLAPPL